MSEHLIVCRGLSKAYGPKVALSGVDLSLIHIFRCVHPYLHPWLVCTDGSDGGGRAPHGQ